MAAEVKETRKKVGKKRRKVAWGITGSGDRLVETVDVMKEIQRRYQNDVEVVVYLSKAGDHVVKYYRLANDLKKNFDTIWVEIDPNSPFLAGQLQTGRFDFLLIAPATSNTVAKISMGIADSLLCNAAIMGLKAFVPLYIMPSDYEEGMIVTKLPNGRDLTLRIRKEDVEHVKKLATMDDVSILEYPAEIYQVFKKHFKPKETK
ncbi:MAG: archaeoflavoprotein AfpA [Candidatus Bathyarchaeota archaeon]|nr:archaeoflavoprotein AfpA [Candidatus Bathyarchaeota archaeon]